MSQKSFFMELITFTKPYIKYSFVIFDDLTFKLWYEDVTLDARNYLHIVETNKLSYFSQIERFLELLPNLNCPAISINDEINNCVQKLDNLAKNVEWENTYSNLYKQIRNEGMLIIPSFRYIKKLISAISVETGLTDQTIKYLGARIAKLNDREKIGSLIFDEIYVAKRCEFSRSTGQIFDMENNQPTKIYNNFQKRIVFECPNFGDMPVSPNFNDIVELYNIDLSKPIKMAYQLSDECLNPQPIEKTKVGLAVRVVSESTINAMTYYVKNGHSEWQGTLNFLTLVAKWWKLLNVKSRSKGIRQRDPDSDPINAGNIGNLEFLNKFATSLEEWMKQTFLSCQQTSQSFPLLVKYLIEKRGLDYVLIGNFHSDPLERRFGRYRQLNGANYFGSEKQFLEGEKSIRVKSLIKFSKYTMKEVVNILGTDDSKQNEAVELHSETVSNMMLPKSTRCRMLDRDIVYYVAEFVARSIKKGVKCVSCGNILGSDSGVEMKIDGISPLECQSFLDMINRGGLVISYTHHVLSHGMCTRELWRVMKPNRIF